MEKRSRIMIAGSGSSCGKTTAVCAILGALKAMGEKSAAFKCGPDFIDPMFHRAVLGERSSNLDLFLSGEKSVLNILGENGDGKISVIEGVMGFYDGLGGATSKYSSHDLSRRTNTPVILMVDCRGKSLSIAAEIKGYLDFAPNNIQGVILNNVNPVSYDMYKNIVEENLGVKVYGYLPKMEAWSIKSRHLGLVTPDGIEEIDEKLALLGEKSLETLDIHGIISLATAAAPLTYEKIYHKKLGDCKIAVAYDKAFCFYYKENLELIEKLGGEIIYFSPLEDRSIPRDADALIIGGGYPELYLKELGGNLSMVCSIQNAINSQMPLWAECGGFLYLLESMIEANFAYPLCGGIKGVGRMTDKLVRFGYSTLKASEDTLLLGKGAKINVHEFHYSDTDNNGSSCVAEKARGDKKWQCVHGGGNIFAGYPHLHLYGNLSCGEAFINAALRFAKKKKVMGI